MEKKKDLLKEKHSNVIINLKHSFVLFSLINGSLIIITSEIDLWQISAQTPQSSDDYNKIIVGDVPTDIAVSPNTNTIYVASDDYDSNIVYVIDSNTNNVIKTIPVGNETKGVAIDPNNNRAYVTIGGYNINNYLYVIDGNINTIIKTIPMKD